MTTRRAVTYGGLSCLLAAWLASAASTTFQAPPPEESERGTQGSSTEALAIEVQAQTTRLRQRLQASPTPQLPQRNPFAFVMRSEPAARPLNTRRAEPVATAGPQTPPEPMLVLIGIAEDQGPSGPTRTAIIADDRETILMVTVGQNVLGRYRVDAIGADAVELKDVATDAVKRLGLR